MDGSHADFIILAMRMQFYAIEIARYAQDVLLLYWSNQCQEPRGLERLGV